mmetsp:Transcript_4216/g.10861  ORF Transcript_4216/g.10861 Transcript_4216/m.10861 type:complete len:411 (+) Transcript_4216:188-1420(+)
MLAAEDGPFYGFTSTPTADAQLPGIAGSCQRAPQLCCDSLRPAGSRPWPHDAASLPSTRRARSRAIASVASGRAAASALAAIAVRMASSASHAATWSPISAGDCLKTPKPASATKSTLPASCPGRNDESTVGSPIAAASAIVPGPALVTSASAAAMYRSMSVTYPRARARTPSGKACAPTAARAASLRPHTTTICAPPGMRPSALPVADATSASPPMPSPPPTTRTVGSEESRLSWARTAPRSPTPVRPRAKAGRMGSPCCTSWSSRSPACVASSRNASLGTKQASTSRWNHVGCAEPRSVTTVANGVVREPPSRRASARSGAPWRSGWTETTQSGRGAALSSSSHFWPRASSVEISFKHCPRGVDPASKSAAHSGGRAASHVYKSGKAEYGSTPDSTKTSTRSHSTRPG